MVGLSVCMYLRMYMCMCMYVMHSLFTQKYWNDQLHFFCGHSRDSWPAWVCIWVLWFRSLVLGSVLFGQSCLSITHHITFYLLKITVKAEVGTYNEQDSKAEHWQLPLEKRKRKQTIKNAWSRFGDIRQGGQIQAVITQDRIGLMHSE